MAISDLACAELMNGLYAYPGVPPVTWDHLDPGDDDGVCWGLKALEGQKIVVLRGSVTLQDWIRDFDCLAAPWAEGGLGPVHPGFLLGMTRVAGELAALGLGPGSVVVGHSLGAGRACILTGLLVLSRLPPARRVCFGEPKPGFAALGALIEGTPASSYCAGNARGHDLVTDVPFSFPPEEYQHPAPLTSLTVNPAPGDPWGMFAYHHMQGYQAGLQALAGRNAP
jgi:hypothetical protein